MLIAITVGVKLNTLVRTACLILTLRALLDNLLRLIDRTKDTWCVGRRQRAVTNHPYLTTSDENGLGLHVLPYSTSLG